jgi:hypothetical protein
MGQASDPGTYDATRRTFLTIVAPPRQRRTVDELAEAGIASERRGVADWRVVAREELRVSGRPAIHVRATGTLSGVPRTVDLVFVLSAKREVTLTVSCPTQEAARRRATLQRILDSLQVP